MKQELKGRYEGVDMLVMIAWKDYKLKNKGFNGRIYRKVIQLFFLNLFEYAVKIPSGISLPHGLGRLILHYAPSYDMLPYVNATFKKNNNASALYSYKQRTENRIFFLVWKPSLVKFPILRLYVNRQSRSFADFFKQYFNHTGVVVSCSKQESYKRSRSDLNKVDFLTDLYKRYQEMKK